MPQKKKKMDRKAAIKMWFMLALVFVAAIGMMAPSAAYAQEPSCQNGVDQNGDPCLDLKVDALMSNIFKWANMIIPVLLPLVAIGIGIQFGGNILSSIKNFFGSFRLG